MANNWYEVWSNRSVALANSGCLLDDLLRVDGYDTAMGMLSAPILTDYVDQTIQRLGLTGTESLFEVGCGAGAFLYPFYSRGFRVSGLDYSSAMLEKARDAMPGMNFETGEAVNLDAGSHSDLLVACSVFHYFESLDYAHRVVGKMIQAATKYVLIIDVPDVALKEQSEANSRGLMGEEESARKYKGLEHLYFSKSFFEELADDHRCTLEITPQAFEGYINFGYRFDVLLNLQG